MILEASRAPSPQTQTAAATLALFTSVSTLLCCALPALLVSVGAGATLAGLVAAVPQLVFFSEHKGLIFAVGGFMLLVAMVLRYAARNAPCPIEPQLAATCKKIRSLGGVVLYMASGLYMVGFFFAFLAVNLL